MKYVFIFAVFLVLLGLCRAALFNETSRKSKLQELRSAQRGNLFTKFQIIKRRDSDPESERVGAYCYEPFGSHGSYLETLAYDDSVNWRNALNTKSYMDELKKSEIPILYSDNDQRPSTVNERRVPYYRRYEGDGDHVRINYRNPAHKKIRRTNWAIVRLFRNGDPDHKGLPLTINRNCSNFENLLKVLDDKIPTPIGVKYIFKWPEGFEIRSVKEFQNRCVYIVSSTKNLRNDIKYGESNEGFWYNAKPSASKVRQDRLLKLFKRPSS